TELDQIPDPLDRQIVALLSGLNRPGPLGISATTTTLGPQICDLLLPMLARTGRLHLQPDGTPESLQPPCVLDEGPPWELRLALRPSAAKDYLVAADLARGDERMALDEPELLLQSGWLFAHGRLARLQPFGAFPWIVQLRREETVRVPARDAADFLESFLPTIGQAPLALPDDLRFEESTEPPQPWIKIARGNKAFRGTELTAETSFDYAGHRFAAGDPQVSIYLPGKRLFVRRQPEFERQALSLLPGLGFRTEKNRFSRAPAALLLKDSKLPKAVAGLVTRGWKVEAEGKLFRSTGKFKIEVKSGIDWFELHGTMDFDGASVSLPALLAAARKGEDTILLDDGSLGMLPADWLKKWGLLSGAGTAQGDHVRFQTSQASLLDALLASQPEATCDELFLRAREGLRRFDRIEALDPPASFQGTLRDYQREGLGWLEFLRAMHFGGCLADDMGLGKTVQVLALLEARRAREESALAATPQDAVAASAPREPHLPSLAVVPRSVLFNWRQEAAKFAPQLRIMEHSGAERKREAPDFSQVDLLLTTYGTLRRDITFLKDIPFDTVILDEAQAIKNASTAQAKAARLLTARHRLALSGTPVENHLGELWSLLEFLNPGLLGSASVFQALSGDGRNLDDEARTLLARALRPFLLRRTKGQVAKDLPERTEQTLVCELEGAQRKQYDELLEHYRHALLGTVDEQGMKKSAIQVLEALLRLRQAACHPGLIDKSRGDESSAKLDALLPNLTEVLDENHKALVFSQFTSFLAIVRKRLDAEKIPYAYLDGKTRDREACVHRFQTDPDCKLFLISLKAGGLGLNLTAAEYVYLLDPWWNPAVEAQAIDRTHRIGQTRQVFAYRLIARNTIEEKVLQLQQSKRDLADAIITQDNSLIRNLTRDDLALLLS
ncbi:MAG TPA: DEAD/DEAH box helicase, partial [Planctomycetota bacterium]|nr:DEAD/DEAH box helicase [Planctomycetota bacterium]